MTEAALLAAIMTDPEDDLPRLAYADWLEENGRGERAEFVRVQCRLAEHEAAVKQRGTSMRDIAPLPPGFLIFSEREALRRREKELLESLGANPFAWFPGGVSTVGLTAPVASYVGPPNGLLRRGFVATVTCTAEDWLRHGDAISAAQPVEEVRLTTDLRLLGDLLATERVRLSRDECEAELRRRWPLVRVFNLP